MRAITILALLALAACTPDPSPAEKAAQDARDVAAVERASRMRPPPENLVPEPITPADMEARDLFGGRCAMMHPSGAHAVAFGMRDDGYFKREGELVRLGADKGSPQQPFQSWVKYDGREYAMRLRILGEREGTESQSVADGAKGTGEYPGELVIRDRFDRPIFEMRGTIRCDD